MIVYLKYVEVEPIGSANQESGNNEKARWILLGLTLAMNGVYTKGKKEQLTRMLGCFDRFIRYESYPKSGIFGPPGQGTNQSELVQDFHNF